ncbi:MAG: response regulator [Chloroflexota bacterium]|nr:response regulator [Chloroflexota bacterium]
MHIGLLEDDTSIQEMIRLVLQEEGYTVTVYPTAEECLSSLIPSDQAQQPRALDLLIADWRLSGTLSGVEAIRQLRSSNTYKTLPIILTTAVSFVNIEELQDLDVVLLEKPFAVDDIVNLIASLT